MRKKSRSCAKNSRYVATATALSLSLLHHDHLLLLLLLNKTSALIAAQEKASVVASLEAKLAGKKDSEVDESKGKKPKRKKGVRVPHPS
jgi:hypothetical protein